MMKSLLFLLLFTVSVGLTAQSTLRMEHTTGLSYDGSEILKNVESKNSTRFPGTAVGLTFYDLQSNASTQNRIKLTDDGELLASWTMSLDEFDAAFPNRGSGFNQTSGGDFGSNPNARIESFRTGWPSVNALSDGTPIIVTHTSDPTMTFPPLNFAKQTAPGMWDISSIPTATTTGLLWPRMTVDAKGYIHVIAITTPVANNGAIHEGVDGHFLYYRSKDGGATWDITDGILPGLDNTTQNANGGDSYAMSSNGDVIAFAVFDNWNDVTVHKSTDNGDSWERIVINDFPLDNWVRGSAYNLDDIGGVDTLGPGADAMGDSTLLRAIYTSDGNGSVVVDQSGMVHVFYGAMYITDADFNADGWNFYPFTNETQGGIAYWNESIPAGTRPPIIASPEDTDNDGNLAVDGADANAVANYSNNYTSMPFAAMDDNGEMFLAYSSIMENYMSADGQHYNHVYLMKSTNGGANWGEPFDVINPDLFEDDDELFQFVEAVFPSIQVDDQFVHLIYQQDFEPGLAVRGDEDPVFEQEIVYLKIDKSTLTLVENVVNPSALGMSLAPNPSSAVTQISFDLLTEQNVGLQIINMQGQVMQTQDLGNMPSGNYQKLVDVSNLRAGNYIVKLSIGKRAASMKLSVR